MNRNEALAEQAKVDADRDALYRAEAAGQAVPVEAWIALGARQQAVSNVLAPTNAQGYYI